MTTEGAARRFQLASPVTALVLGLLVLALIIADVPLAALAHQGLGASGGSLPAVALGSFRAGRLRGGLAQAGQPTGLDHPRYRGLPRAQRGCRLLFGGRLPAPAWRTAAGLGGLARAAQLGTGHRAVRPGRLFFPNGRPPSPWMRWMVWVVLAVGLLWIASAFAMTVGAIIGHHLQVDPGREPGRPGQ